MSDDSNNTDKLVPPYVTGSLVDRNAADKSYILDLRREVFNNLPVIQVSQRAMNDALMIADGSFTPLTGFMNERDWRSVCSNWKLSNGIFWPVPITLDVSLDDIKLIEKNNPGFVRKVGLAYNSNIFAVLEINDVWQMIPSMRQLEADLVFRGHGPDSNNWKDMQDKHPGVQDLIRKEWCLGGIITVIDNSIYAHRAYKSPATIRKLLVENNWGNVVGFQTHNPPNMVHEYIIRFCLDTGYDGVVIQTNTGQPKLEGVPVDVRLDCLYAVVNRYLNTRNALIAEYPFDTRYAGPREALLHAIYRQNCGINNIIVGHDHAGVMNFYTPTESQEAFGRFSVPDYLLCRPIKIPQMYYCSFCGCMASDKSCPHDPRFHTYISGAQIRELLKDDTTDIQPYISRPEVIQLLRDYHQTIGKKYLA